MNWIKCSEKMPEVGQNVVVGWFNGGYFTVVAGEVEKLDSWDELVIMECCRFVGIDPAYYWFPIPAEPNEVIK